MNATAQYAAQKTREAVTSLAVSPQPLRDRVCHACFVLHVLTAHEIADKSLQDRLIVIMTDYEKKQPNDNTLSHLSDQDVSRIAGGIISIYEGCIALYSRSI